jgi:membrane protein
MLLLANTEFRRGATVAGIGGILLLLFGATSLFLAVQHALDEVWRVRVDRDTSLGFHIGLRAAVVFLAVFFPAAVLGILFSMRGFASTISGATGPSVLTTVGAWAIGALGGWALIVLVWAVLPDGRPGWKSMLIGSGVTALTWGIANWLFNLYFAFTSASRFPLAGALIGFVLWVFLMAQLFLAGARLAYEFGCMTGHPVEPRPWAELYETVSEDET